MRDFFESLENKVYTALSLLFALATLFFIAPQSKSLTLFTVPVSSNHSFYLVFLFLGVATLGSVIYFSPDISFRNWKKMLTPLLIVFLPAVLLMTYGLSESNNFHYIFILSLGVYVIVAGILLSALYIEKAHATASPDPAASTVKQWFIAQGVPSLLFVIGVTCIFFLAGFYNLTHYAAVDEPLWLEGRIGKYWNNIEQRDWKGTRISDKPGITVALATGTGLFTQEPKRFDNINGQIEAVKSFYFDFRFPLLLVITLLLPLFYFFLERLLGRRNALFSYAFIALSPVLIGMAKIINPDSLLWLFAPLSLLSYLAFLKRDSYRYLVFSGIFLGFALLTKYVANILFIFFLGLIFLEYIYNPKVTALTFAEHLKKSLSQLVLLTFTALSTFYLFFPAVWIKPEKLLGSTVFSQAFVKVAPLFLILIGFILLDQWFGKSRITSALLGFLSRIKHWIAYALSALFLGALLFVLWNTWAHMPVYNFQELLASPKTIASRSDFLGVLLSNFYPLIFGVTPLVFLLLFLAPIQFFRKNFSQSTAYRTAFYLMFFIFLYYIGTTVNNVVAIVRYQIILFPLAAIIAGITLEHILVILHRRFKVKPMPTPVFTATGVAMIGVFSLLVNPFHLSYANAFLPGSYHIDIKDMGAGSYEAAMYLNSLPNASSLLIWTDKDGVCKFFVGKCKGNNRNYPSLREGGIDYIVVSAGRKNRTTKMMLGDVAVQKPGLIRFDQYYDREDPVWRLHINNRPSHYVKIFKFKE